MRILRAVALIFTSILFFQCQKELSYIGGPDIQPAIPAPVTAVLQGNIVDENGQPAAGVSIKVGNQTAITDAKGYFRIKDAELDKNASLVTAEKTGYFKTYRTFPATSGVNQVEIKLIRRDLTGTIDAATGGEVGLNSGFKVALPAAGVVVASTGAAYSGTVNVYAAFIDPTAQDINLVVPGSFIANNKDGGRVTLASYGMLAVELESTGGEKLQIKQGSKAKLTSTIPSSLLSSAPSSIPAWFVDEATGIWKEEGSAQRSGNEYIGEVSHFTFWNWDVPAPAITMSMTVKTPDGEPVVHAWVRVISNSASFPGTPHGITDSLGQVGGVVPANTQMTIEVLDRCYNPVYTQTVGPFAQSTNIGDIIIPANNQGLRTITGTVLNCSSSPVTEGYVTLVHQNIVRYANVDANGNFSISFIYCAASPSDFQVIAVDANAMQQSSFVSGTISGTTTNVGNLFACGTNAEQYVNFNLNGTDFSFIPPLDSLTTSTSPDSLGTGLLTIISGTRKTGAQITHAVSINMAHDVQANGNYPAKMAISYPTQQIVMALNNEINVVVTHFATAPGDFHEGSFSGTFQFAGATHSVTNGTFRVRRIF